MNKITKSILSVLTLAAIGGGAHAGLKMHQAVEIFADYANGQFGETRNSAADLEYIGCSLYQWAPDSMSGTCVAVDANNQSVSCYFMNRPDLMAIVQAMESDSWIGFGWNKSGECTVLMTDVASYNGPK